MSKNFFNFNKKSFIYLILLILILLIVYGSFRLPFSPCKHFGIEAFIKSNIKILRYIINSFLGIILIFGIILFRKEKLFWFKIIILLIFILVALFFINFVFFAASACSLDARQRANIAEIRAAEEVYFEKYGYYTSLEELIKVRSIRNPNDEFTKKPYKIEITSDDISFWIRAYLPQAEEWYICNKDKCFLAESL